jgi:hypothetical protein
MVSMHIMHSLEIGFEYISFSVPVVAPTW